MDQINSAAADAGLKNAISQLDNEHAGSFANRESDALKNMVVKLNRQLQTERKQLAAERAQLRVLREANEQLVLSALRAEDARAEAEAVRQRQNVFLSMLAHELRNPMASIAVANTVMGSLHIDHPRLDKLMAIVKRQSHHLVRLVDDLLDASRIATGKISLHCGPVDLCDVIGSALEASQPTLSARGQATVLALPPGPLLMSGDSVRLAQLFSNLLVNASKFSAIGEVITVSGEAEGGTIAVRVSDHGRGITAHDQACIFDLFEQGSELCEHGCASGLGIGLSLVRAIAEMHGGSVRVDSAGAGCGSTFTVRLPLTPA